MMPALIGLIFCGSRMPAHTNRSVWKMPMSISCGWVSCLWIMTFAIELSAVETCTDTNESSKTSVPCASSNVSLYSLPSCRASSTSLSLFVSSEIKTKPSRGGNSKPGFEIGVESGFLRVCVRRVAGRRRRSFHIRYRSLQNKRFVFLFGFQKFFFGPLRHKPPGSTIRS